MKKLPGQCKTKKETDDFAKKHYALGKQRFVYEGTIEGQPADINIMAMSKEESLEKIKTFVKSINKDMVVSRLTSFNPKTKKGTIDVFIVDLIITGKV